MMCLRTSPERTGGDIYLGVVGPSPEPANPHSFSALWKSGVLPNIEDIHERENVDEMPQSGFPAEPCRRLNLNSFLLRLSIFMLMMVMICG